MRLVDADKFRSELDNHYPFTKDEQSKHGMADIAKSTVLFVLNAMPTVDAVTVRHGYWRHYEGMLYCSECGTEFYDDIMEYCGDNVPHFCPECGARMDGKGNSND